MLLNGFKYCYPTLIIQFNIISLLNGEPGNNGNEVIHHIPQSFRAGASPSDGLVSYPGHSLGAVFLPISRDAVGVFYSPGRLGFVYIVYYFINSLFGWDANKGIFDIKWR